MSGRKGTVNVMYEVVISLILLGIFAAVVFLYISNNANGTQYFSRFYSSDLSTTVELVAAGNGDVILRYDNLKPNIDLAFWFSNGEVAVSDPPAGHTVLTSSGIIETDAVTTPPPYAERRSWNKADEYLPTALINPTYLAIRKIGSAMAVTEAETIFAACPKGSLRAPSLVLALDGFTQDEQERLRGTLESLTSLNLASDGELTVSITRAAGPQNTLLIMGGGDGAAVGCVFSHHLQMLTFAEFSTTETEGTGQMLDMKITIDSETRVSAEQIAKALALALGEVYG